MRQFVLYDLDGDYDHMEQLHLTLSIDGADPELAALGSATVWSGPGPEVEDWVQEVESLDAFATIVRRDAARAAVLHHEDV
jgi:hypothetical protein